MRKVTIENPPLTPLRTLAIGAMYFGLWWLWTWAIMLLGSVW